MEIYLYIIESPNHRSNIRQITVFFGESSGNVSLEQLFSWNGDEQIYGESRLSLDDIAYLVCRGGWPQTTLLTGDDALIQAYDYLDAVVRSDINRADGINRNEERTKMLVRSYARHQGTAVPFTAIARDIEAHDDMNLSQETILSYTNALRKIFVIEDCPAWSPNLRSKTAIRTSDTRYFTDPSIVAAALGIGPQDLMNDLNTCGLLFETMCMRDLRVYAESLEGNVYHFRTKEGLECDGVIHLRNGRYGLVEFKLGGEKLIEDGARSLLKTADIIDKTKMKEPSFLMVLTAVGSYAYRRKDGVLVVPIGCLRN
ncbi:MAG: DUF4143 domain-containing protein [Solobacterium sp.]|nr:DUF4143 domain-containing protein [Solobacterium sp.]